MREPMSSTDPAKAPREPTLDEMLAGIDAALSIPEPIGSMCGAVVYLHHDTRELSWEGSSGRVSIDHPYLMGTTIRDSAIERLDHCARIKTE